MICTARPNIAKQVFLAVTGGLPFPLIKKQPISTNHPETTLQTAYFLEFNNALAKVADVPAAINHALQVLGGPPGTPSPSILAVWKRVP